MQSGSTWGMSLKQAFWHSWVERSWPMTWLLDWQEEKASEGGPYPILADRLWCEVCWCDRDVPCFESGAIYGTLDSYILDDSRCHLGGVANLRREAENSKIGQEIREATGDSNAKFPIVGHPQCCLHLKQWMWWVCSLFVLVFHFFQIFTIFRLHPTSTSVFHECCSLSTWPRVRQTKPPLRWKRSKRTRRSGRGTRSSRGTLPTNERWWSVTMRMRRLETMKMSMTMRIEMYLFGPSTSESRTSLGNNTWNV